MWGWGEFAPPNIARAREVRGGTSGIQRAVKADFPVGPLEGLVADVFLSAAERDVYGAVSARAAAGGRTLSRRAPPKQSSRNGRDALHRLQPLLDRLPGKSHCSGMGADGRPPQKAHHVHLRPVTLHVLRHV